MSESRAFARPRETAALGTPGSPGLSPEGGLTVSAPKAPRRRWATSSLRLTPRQRRHFSSNTCTASGPPTGTSPPRIWCALARDEMNLLSDGGLHEVAAVTPPLRRWSGRRRGSAADHRARVRTPSPAEMAGALAEAVQGRAQKILGSDVLRAACTLVSDAAGTALAASTSAARTHLPWRLPPKGGRPGVAAKAADAPRLGPEGVTTRRCRGATPRVD